MGMASFAHARSSLQISLLLGNDPEGRPILGRLTLGRIRGNLSASGCLQLATAVGQVLAHPVHGVRRLRADDVVEV